MPFIKCMGCIIDDENEVTMVNSPSSYFMIGFSQNQCAVASQMVFLYVCKFIMPFINIQDIDWHLLWRCVAYFLTLFLFVFQCNSSVIIGFYGAFFQENQISMCTEFMDGKWCIYSRKYSFCSVVFWWGLAMFISHPYPSRLLHMIALMPIKQLMAWCCQSTSHYLNQC